MLKSSPARIEFRMPKEPMCRSGSRVGVLSCQWQSCEVRSIKHVLPNKSPGFTCSLVVEVPVAPMPAGSTKSSFLLDRCLELLPEVDAAWPGADARVLIPWSGSSEWLGRREGRLLQAGSACPLLLRFCGVPSEGGRRLVLMFCMEGREDIIYRYDISRWAFVPICQQACLQDQGASLLHNKKEIEPSPWCQEGLLLIQQLRRGCATLLSLPVSFQ
eukprot:1139582-Pelagomonas_calceolata.AAC.3